MPSTPNKCRELPARPAHLSAENLKKTPNSVLAKIEWVSKPPKSLQNQNKSGFKPES